MELVTYKYWGDHYETKKHVCLLVDFINQSGFSVLRPGFCKNDLYRWLADPKNTNLNTNFQTIQRSINKALT